MSSDYVEYQTQVLKNAQVMAGAFIERGYKLVSGESYSKGYISPGFPCNKTAIHTYRGLHGSHVGWQEQYKFAPLGS